MLVLLPLQLFRCETRIRGQFVASTSLTFARPPPPPSPLMVQSQRDEASQRLVKHYIMILLHSESNYYNTGPKVLNI